MLHTCFTTSWLPTISGNWQVLVRNGRQTVFWKCCVFLGEHVTHDWRFFYRARVIVPIPHTFSAEAMVLRTGGHIWFHFMRPPVHDLPVPKICGIDNNPFWCRQIVARWCFCNLAYLNVSPVRGCRTGRRIKAVVSPKKSMFVLLAEGGSSARHNIIIQFTKNRTNESFNTSTNKS